MARCATGLRLSLAISDYDHVRDLCNGAVEAKGLALDVQLMPVQEIFRRVLRRREWDACEMSMGMYVALKAAGDDSLTAIPVFPSRMFRLSAFYVRGDGPVREAADLRGRRVGDPDWAMTAGIYARAWLQHEVGVPLTAIEWIQAGVDAPGRTETLDFRFPPGLRRSSRPDASLNALLAAGEIDAVLSAQPPHDFLTRSGKVRRLITDFAERERAYFRQTGIFPIMHVVALRREVAAAHPWVAPRLLAAFDAAKRRSLDRLRDSMASRVPNPWAFAWAEEAAALFGADPWPYGVAHNRRTLEAFLEFCAEQGIGGARRVAVEELFAPGAEEVPA